MLDQQKKYFLWPVGIWNFKFLFWGSFLLLRSERVQQEYTQPLFFVQKRWTPSVQHINSTQGPLLFGPENPSVQYVKCVSSTLKIVSSTLNRRQFNTKAIFCSFFCVELTFFVLNWQFLCWADECVELTLLMCWTDCFVELMVFCVKLTGLFDWRFLGGHCFNTKFF